MGLLHAPHAYVVIFLCINDILVLCSYQLVLKGTNIVGMPYPFVVLPNFLAKENNNLT